MIHPTLPHVRFHTYRRVPKNLLFSSDMHSNENQDLCGGWGRPPWDAELQQVILRRKPFGWICEPDDRSQHIAERAEAAGLHLNISEPRASGHYAGYRDFEFCQRGHLVDLFDLNALARDYVRELPGVVLPAEICAHAHNEMTCYFHNQWDSPPQPLWLTGLILGYPLENTIAVYRQ